MSAASRGLLTLLTLLAALSALRAPFASPRTAEGERECIMARVQDAMGAGRRRLALYLRMLRLRVALTRLTWLAEDGSGESEADVAGEDGSGGTANADGSGSALRGVLLLLPTPGIQPGLGEDGIVVVPAQRRLCQSRLTTWARETTIKSMVAPSGSALSLVSSLRALSSPVVGSAALEAVILSCAAEVASDLTLSTSAACSLGDFPHLLELAAQSIDVRTCLVEVARATVSSFRSATASALARWVS
jgi:hypothetical protein